MISTYGEELVVLNAKRQGIASLKQYARKVEQAMKLQAVQGDMEENPDKYYPEDKAVLQDYLQEDTATFTHILIAKETLEDEAEQAASNEEKRAKAEEILARIQNGEDFDTLLAEVGEDKNLTAEGYSFEKGSTGMDAVEEATLKLKADEISEVVESDQGYHIIKRMVGLVELEDYWKAQAKIKVKEGKIKKISLQEILDNINTATEDFEKLYEETQKTAK
jgi:parvulin-like peptidyl-prolyl isomerase